VIDLKEEIPVNDRYPPDGFDPAAVSWSAMLPSFTSPSQAISRLARLREAQCSPMSAKETDSARDERDERLQRAGYLLVVYLDGLVGAAAAFMLAVCRRPMKQAVALVQAVVRQASRAKS
jgi:hypothetical protein